MLPFLRIGSKKQMQKNNSVIVTRFMVMRNNVMDYANYNGNMMYPTQQVQGQYQNQSVYTDQHSDDKHKLPSISITNNSMNYYNQCPVTEDENKKNGREAKKEVRIKSTTVTDADGKHKLTTITEGSQSSDNEYDVIEYEGECPSGLTSTSGSSFLRSSDESLPSLDYKSKSKSKSGSSDSSSCGSSYSESSGSKSKSKPRSKSSKGSKSSRKSKSKETESVSVGVQTQNPGSEIGPLPDQELRFKLMSEVLSETELEQRRKNGKCNVDPFGKEKNSKKNQNSDSNSEESNSDKENIKKNDSGIKKKTAKKITKKDINSEKDDEEDANSKGKTNTRKTKITRRITKRITRTKKGKSDMSQCHRHHRHHHKCVLDPNIPLTEAQRKIIIEHIKHHHHQHDANKQKK